MQALTTCQSCLARGQERSVQQRISELGLILTLLLWETSMAMARATWLQQTIVVPTMSPFYSAQEPAASGRQVILWWGHSLPASPSETSTVTAEVIWLQPTDSQTTSRSCLAPVPVVSARQLTLRLEQVHSPLLSQTSILTARSISLQRISARLTSLFCSVQAPAVSVQRVIFPRQPPTRFLFPSET